MNHLQAQIIPRKTDGLHLNSSSSFISFEPISLLQLEHILNHPTPATHPVDPFPPRLQLN